MVVVSQQTSCLYCVTDDLWRLIATETNRQAASIKAAKSTNYVAKNFTNLTVEELKAFMGCRIAMEMLISKTGIHHSGKQKVAG